MIYHKGFNLPIVPVDRGDPDGAAGPIPVLGRSILWPRSAPCGRPIATVVAATVTATTRTTTTITAANRPATGTRTGRSPPIADLN
ncbi:hypothetical protein BRC86_07600 [Halobacteriales archaeon QS_3_64_16]|nr:MAG: hypothetical protein BRC86_07600 [Halobacteriales archaeon QS_3_64_16]